MYGRILWLVKDWLYRDASWEAPCTLFSGCYLLVGMVRPLFVVARQREAGAELASASASSLLDRAERAARAVEAGVGAELALSAMRAAPLAAPDGVAADCDLARCPRRRAPRLCRGLPLLAVFWFFLFSTTFTFSI